VVIRADRLKTAIRCRCGIASRLEAGLPGRHLPAELVFHRDATGLR